MNIRPTPRLGSTIVDSATVEAWRDSDGHVYLLYQPRDAQGDLRFHVGYRDTAYDGWTGELVFAASADEAFELVRSQQPRSVFPSEPVNPDLGRDPIGWSPEQQGRAVVWAADLSDGVLQIARKYGAKAAA